MKTQYEQCHTYFTERVFKYLPNHVVCWVAGGAIANFFTTKSAHSDIDVWFPSDAQWQAAVDHIKRTYPSTWKVIKETPAAITYVVEGQAHPVQFVRRFFYASPKETINAFDFTVCMGACTRGGLVVVHDDFFLDLAAKRLVTHNLQFTYGTLARLQKYIKKGYTICNGGLLNLHRAIQQDVPFEPTNPEQVVYLD